MIFFQSLEITQTVLPGEEETVQLGVHALVQETAHGRAGGYAAGGQIASHQERLRRFGEDAKTGGSSADLFDPFRIGGGVRLCQFQQKVETISPIGEAPDRWVVARPEAV